ncbi:N-acetyltransferase [Lutibacter sp. HS1-25]|uniref:GNAT family N-acetyltransferase n=1 Tax=Lutibacter sp. HS1-25 TaxID=2485000 RepID=UPI001012D870|nr:GNAT family N-acetyltransferase [Lutibacter sp. HS1-25]RXP57101.1 N-acetyltransferase [Lutibacter sp. HS1-25]
MKIILETKRLYLREFMLNDGFYFYHLNKDPEVLKYTGDIPFNSVEEATLFIKNYSDYKINGFGRWAVCLKNSNDFIGWCGLKKDLKTNEVDLGFRIFKNQWQNGYATEAALACVNYGFSELNLTKIIGRAYVVNKASINVLAKCNFNFKKNIIYHQQPAVLYIIENDTNKKNIS